MIRMLRHGLAFVIGLCFGLLCSSEWQREALYSLRREMHRQEMRELNSREEPSHG